MAFGLVPSATLAADEVPHAPPAASVTLVEDGKTSWHLVNRSTESATVRFAATELRDYVEKMSGARLERAVPSGEQPQIVIGLRKDLGADDAAMLPPAADGHDGYAVALRAEADGAPARIVVGGDNDRGTVYAIYDLLERLGCRWVHPELDPDDPEVVPKKATLSLSATSWSIASPMRIRTLDWYEWRNPNKGGPDTSPDELRAQVDWAMKSRYNTFASVGSEMPPDDPLYEALNAADERGMMRQISGHNFELFFPNDRETFESHPEWFGLRKGRRQRHGLAGNQFCWSNEGAQARFADNVEAFVQARPEVDILPLYGMDSAKHCECEVCAAATPTDNLIGLMNTVVTRLEKTAPHVTVETLGAYKHTKQLPKATPHEKLRIEVAFWGRKVTEGYDEQRYLHRQLKKWARAYRKRLTVYQYYSDTFAGPAIAAPYTKQIRGDRRHLLALGTDGVFNLLYPDGFWWRQTLNGHLAGRSFYDTSIDPDAILRDYTLTYHGPKAGPLMASYYAEWAENPELASRTRSRTKPEDREALARQRREFIAPALEAVAGEPLYLHRVEKAEKLHRMAEALMDLQLAIAEATELRLSARRNAAIDALADANKQRAVVEELLDALVNEDIGLMEKGDFMYRATHWLRKEAKAQKAPIEPAAKKKAAPRSPEGSPDAPPAATP